MNPQRGGTTRLSVTNSTLDRDPTRASRSFDVRNGTLALDGGFLLTDRLLLTNAAGRLQFPAGTSAAQTVTVSNGAR